MLFFLSATHVKCTVWTNCSHTWPTCCGYFCRYPGYSASTLCCPSGECSCGCISSPGLVCFWVLLISLFSLLKCWWVDALTLPFVCVLPWKTRGVLHYPQCYPCQNNVLLKTMRILVWWPSGKRDVFWLRSSCKGIRQVCRRNAVGCWKTCTESFSCPEEIKICPSPRNSRLKVEHAKVMPKDQILRHRVLSTM